MLEPRCTRVDFFIDYGRVLVMNTDTQSQKERVIKSLAILGLLGLIIIIAWGSVQAVKYFPTAVQSLASLADSVYNYDVNKAPEVTLTDTATSTHSGEVLVVAWDTIPATGVYTLSYACEEGLEVKIQSGESDFNNASCDTAYTLGLVDNASLIVSSTKLDTATFTYTVAYFKTNAIEKTSFATHSVEIHNGALVVAPTEPEEELPVVPEVVTPSVPTTPTVPEVTPTTPAKPTTKPTPQYEYTYVVPTSDPNGFSDLQITYLGIGTVGSNGVFKNTGTLRKDAGGAIQFSVINVGTKTSSDWNFTATLPGKTLYESKEQLKLKPNERAILTVSFSAPTSTKPHTFTVELDGGNDVNGKNDRFSWTAQVIN